VQAAHLDGGGLLGHRSILPEISLERAGIVAAGQAGKEPPVAASSRRYAVGRNRSP
jgi:hypothetical protein